MKFKAKPFRYKMVSALLKERNSHSKSIPVKGNGDPTRCWHLVAATEASGTHTTGMHSCWYCRLSFCAVWSIAPNRNYYINDDINFSQSWSCPFYTNSNTTFIKYIINRCDIVYSCQISKHCERIQLVFFMLQWSRYTKILNLVDFWSPSVLIAYKTLKIDHITMSFMDHRHSRKEECVHWNDNFTQKEVYISSITYCFTTFQVCLQYLHVKKRPRCKLLNGIL